MEFLGILTASFASTLLGSMLSGKEVIRAQKEIIRAGKEF